ncbi:helix-turn-helix domain-containing protein [Rhizobium sp. BK008]|uniref:helix-turn-helix domain-containing protein n=1 Tax=Rhizobium sp. BK008 TaxID=2587094 RepID=UPI001621977A|nr:helix-turn-helix domain-containing protein [Rhizobium sp. BK008]MBB4252994.1 IS1 family transposase [Rhizobium sp. BK008]
MNKLDKKTRSQILDMLCEGQSIRGITRVMGMSKNTIAKLLVDAGKVCAEYHDQTIRGIHTSRIQCDEIWSFAYSKEKNVKDAESALEWAGDTWTWTALDVDSKLIVSYLVGGRDAEYGAAFMEDLVSRIANRIQLTTDGHKAYLEAVEAAFGADIDYTMLVKIYGPPPKHGVSVRPSFDECIGAKKILIIGNPDQTFANKSSVERQSLTMHMRRSKRFPNAFSKKVENHAYAVALHFMHYNFVRIHKSLRMTPAMAAGITDKLWEVSDIVALIEANEARRATLSRSGAPNAM